MSVLGSTTTTTCLDEIQLVNIVSVSELRLQRNFSLLIQCLQNHTSRLDSIEQTARIQGMTFESITNKQDIEEARVNELTTVREILQKRMDGIDSKIEQNYLRTKESISLMSEQMKLMNCLSDDRNIQSHNQIRDIGRLLQNVSTTTTKLESDTEKFRREAGLFSVKADTAFKKAKLVEEKIEKIDEKIHKVIADSVTLRQTLNNALGEGEGYPLMEVNETFEQISLQADQPRQSTCSRATQRRKFTMLSGEPSTKKLIEDLKRRIEQLQINSKEDSAKTAQKINQELNEVKILKIDLKKEILKEKNQNSVIALMEKIEQFKPEINRIAGRVDIIEDKSRNIDRKGEEARRNLNEIALMVRENSSSKYDDRLRLLQSDLISQIKDLSNKLDSKTDIAEFNKSCQDTDNKIKEMSEIIGIKCDKIEVKKALLFIESKIKEIILVISEDQENEKQALLTKKQIKCISCDKDLDKFSGLINIESKNWNMMPGKELHTDSLGKFGISKYGSLAKKLRKLESNDLPILRARKATE